MNIILLTSILITIAPGRSQGGGFNGNSLTNNLASFNNKLEPCEEMSNAEAYEEFAKRHIVRDVFARKSENEWAKYLSKNNLCGRTLVQSFMEAKDEDRVKQICTSGWRLKNRPGNLCISKNKILMYDVKSTKSCKVTQVKKESQYVVVACNKVVNTCLPVHFEDYNKQQPDNKSCQPSA